MASDEARYSDLKKSEAIKDQDRQHAKPFIDAMMRESIHDPNCPRCHGKGAYYKNIMLDVALCSCRRPKWPSTP